MDDVLRGTERYTRVYLDDDVIHSENWKDHLQHIKKILQCMKEANLMIKLKTCNFWRPKVYVLGIKLVKAECVTRREQDTSHTEDRLADHKEGIMSLPRNKL